MVTVRVSARRGVIVFTIVGADTRRGLTLSTNVRYDGTPASIRNALTQARTRLRGMQPGAYRPFISRQERTEFLNTWNPPNTIRGARPAAGGDQEGREQPSTVDLGQRPRVSIQYQTFIAARLQTARGEENEASNRAIAELVEQRDGLNSWLQEAGNRRQAVHTVFNQMLRDHTFAAYISQRTTEDRNVQALTRRLRGRGANRALPIRALNNAETMDTVLELINSFIEFQRTRREPSTFGTRFTLETSRISINVPETMNAELLLMAAMYLRRGEHTDRQGWRSGRAAEQREARDEERERIARMPPRNALLFGDSITNQFRRGNQSDLFRGLRPNVTLHLNARDGRAIHGPNGMLRQIGPAFEQAQRRGITYNEIFICAGGNDLGVRRGRGRTTERNIQRNYNRIISGLERLYNIARDRGVRVIGVTIPPILGYRAETGRDIGIQEEEDRVRIMVNNWIRRQARAGNIAGLVDLEPHFRGRDGRLRRDFWRTSEDCAHHNQRGQDELARQYALQGYPIEARIRRRRTQPRVSPLEQFARENWREIPRQFETAIEQGTPRVIMGLITNLPEGQDSLEAALTELGRADDISRSFDRLFNSVLHDMNDPIGQEFLTFCGTGQVYDYWNIALPNMSLTQRSPRSDRELIIRAARDFLRQVGGRTDEDLRHIDSLNISNNYIRTMLAIAVYRWRLQNPNALPGTWMQEQTETREKRDMKAIPIR